MVTEESMTNTKTTSAAHTDGATWWECPACGDYAWLAPGQEPPECSCSGDPDTLPAAGREADAWWAWHDADPSRHSPGETPTEGTEAAERRCTAWLRGESTDGPDTISRTAPGPARPAPSEGIQRSRVTSQKGAARV